MAIPSNSRHSGLSAGGAFPHPSPREGRSRIIPVFLPHAGCPGRCAFCDQRAQTGAEADPAAALERMRANLDGLDPSRPLEIGFFGGSFTALPRGARNAFLESAGEYARRGTVRGVRCSTRPDALDPALARELADGGLTGVELGAQSLHDRVLQAVGRGHDAESVAQAVEAARSAGLRVGLHLMAGLPGQSPGVFLEDVSRAMALRPDWLRLHPALVLESTPLARSWRARAYRPWPLAPTLELLGKAVLAAWDAGTRVIRVGVAPEPGFAGRVLAGPRHEALGQRAASRALWLHVRRLFAHEGIRPRSLEVPARHLSDALGWRGEMLPRWKALGLGREAIRPVEGDFFLVR